MLSIICPCFNESSAIESFHSNLSLALSSLSITYEIVFIDDGSEDDTFDKMLALKKQHNEIRILKLSRNFGKEAALTAGLEHAKGDAVIPIDVDLQDPPELIVDMVELWQQGFDVVLAKRRLRKEDSLRKRKTAEWFYRIHNKIADHQLPENVGDFRLMDKRVVDVVKRMPERQRFMKGILSWAGFKTTTLDYSRSKRTQGTTKFGWWKLWNLALDGITSFSNAPLKVWWYLGGIISFISFLYGAFIIFKTLILGVDVPGYASLLTVVLFLGGIQLLGLGIIAEYVGRIYIETKQRPIYIIDKEV
ncbi:glycosyltransferase family 2 protein [Aliikangiella sp. IMCC44632]